MGQVYITRRESFSAAHRLYVSDWSDEKNDAAFGKCSNPNWHGHNYVLKVTVKGEPDPISGFVMNLRLLSQLIKEYVLDHVDHRNLNVEVSFMSGIQPSTENLAIAIWGVLEPLIRANGATLHTIEIGETEKNTVSYHG